MVLNLPYHRGQTCDIRDEWGIGLPEMCFGAGFILYIDIVIFIFGKLHENTGMKGSPAMFLLIAPPSVGVVALDMLNHGASDFSQAGEMLLGWVFVLFLLLIRLGPILSKNPSVFGEYWVSRDACHSLKQFAFSLIYLRIQYTLCMFTRHMCFLWPQQLLQLPGTHQHWILQQQKF